MGKSIRKNLYARDVLWEKWKKEAEERGMSLSEFARNAMNQYTHGEYNKVEKIATELSKVARKLEELADRMDEVENSVNEIKSATAATREEEIEKAKHKIVRYLEDYGRSDYREIEESIGPDEALLEEAVNELRRSCVIATEESDGGGARYLELLKNRFKEGDS